MTLRSIHPCPSLGRGGAKFQNKLLYSASIGGGAHRAKPQSPHMYQAVRDPRSNLHFNACLSSIITSGTAWLNFTDAYRPPPALSLARSRAGARAVSALCPYDAPVLRPSPPPRASERVICTSALPRTPRFAPASSASPIQKIASGCTRGRNFSCGRVIKSKCTRGRWTRKMDRAIIHRWICDRWPAQLPIQNDLIPSPDAGALESRPLRRELDSKDAR